MHVCARLAALGVLTVVTACTHEDFERAPALKTYAGNSQKHNSALQIIDPWPQGVQDTDLEVPAERPKVEPTSTTSKPVTGLEIGKN